MANFKDRLITAFPVFSGLLKRTKTLVMNKGIAGGSAGDHTVADIKVGDQLISVMHHSAASLAADLTGEFTISADGVINNDSGTDTSSDFLIVAWMSWTS